MTNKSVDILNPSGQLIRKHILSANCSRKFSLMSEDSITLRFWTREPLQFPVGTSAGDFFITQEQVGKWNATTGVWDYELKFDAYYWLWANKILRYVIPNVDSAKETSFMLTSTIEVHANVIKNCLDFLGIKYGGSPFRIETDSTVSQEAKLVRYENLSVLGGIQAIAEAFGCEWWVNGNAIYFGRCENGDSEHVFEAGINTSSITFQQAKSETPNRLYVYGSDRNLPTNYREVDGNDTIGGVVVRRLMLPECVPYLQTDPDIPENQIVEKVVVLDSVYPRTYLTVSDDPETYSSANEDEDGNENVETFYRLKYGNAFRFSESYVLPNEELHIIFQSGLLNGMEFGAKFNPKGLNEKNGDGSWNPEAQMIEVVVNEDYGRRLPDDVLKPRKGDKFILSGWDSTKMADLGLITDAEQELLEEGQKALVEYTKDLSTCTCQMAWDYMKPLFASNSQPKPGDVVTVIDTAHFGEGGRKSRIVGFEYKLDKPYAECVYTCGENVSVKRLDNIEKKIDGLAKSGTKVQIQNSLDFLSKRYSDRTPYKLSADQGFEAGQFVPGASGGMLGIDKETGMSFGEVDNLWVRCKAYFESMTVIESETMAGKLYIAPGGSVKCVAVRASDGTLVHPAVIPVNAQGAQVDASVATAFRCFFLSEQGGEKSETRMKAGDQAISKTFNVPASQTATQVTNHYWWRLITGVEQSAWTDTETGNVYGYIEVSKPDCAGMANTDVGSDYRAVSDIPAEGDVICQFGSRNASERQRQTAIVIDTTGSDAPSIKLFVGIDSYTLDRRDLVSFGYDAVKGRAYLRSYGDAYMGDRDGAAYLDFDESLKQLLIKGKVVITSPVVNGDGTDTGKTLGDYLDRRAVADTSLYFLSLDRGAPKPAKPTKDSLGSWSTASPDWEADKAIWQTTRTDYTDGTTEFSDPVRVSGRNGADVTISSQSVKYSTGHGAAQPADSTFTLNAVPTNLNSGDYLWSRTEVMYSNGQPTVSYAVSRIGTNGTNATVKSSSVTYAKSTTNVQPADSAFTATTIGALNIALGEYLWTKTTVTYSDDTPVTSYSVSRIGSDGDTTVAGLHIAYATGITGSLPHPTAVTDFATSMQSGKAYQYIGIYTDDQETDSTDFNDYEWARLKGEKGADGKYPEYQWGKSSSSSGEPTAWQDTVIPPAQVAAGEYVWQRMRMHDPSKSSSQQEAWGDAVRLTGDRGHAGESVYLLDLSNEVAGVACDSSGTVTGTLPSSALAVYKGASADSGWTFTVKSASGCTASITGTTLSVTALTDSTALVTVKADKQGLPTLEATMKVYKVIPGGKGDAAVVYGLQPSVDNVTRRMDGTSSVSTVTCDVYRTTGASARMKLTSLPTGFSLKYLRQPDMTSSAQYTSSGVAVDPSGKAKTTSVIFELYNGTTLLDRERIPVVADGNDLLAVKGEADDAKAKAEAAQQWISDNAPELSAVKTSLEGIDYLRIAIKKGATVSNGGLVLSSLFKVGSWEETSDGFKMTSVMAGLNGVRTPGKWNSPFLWGGGDMVDKFYDANGNLRTPALTSGFAATMLRMDGSAYFAKGNIGFNSSGSGWLGNALSWDNDGGATLGNGIRIGSGEGDMGTLGSLVTALTGISNLFYPVDSSGNRIAWKNATASNTDHLRAVVGIASDSFISARGKDGSGGGGGSAFGLARVWGTKPTGTTNDALGFNLGWELKEAVEKRALTSDLTALATRVGTLESQGISGKADRATTLAGYGITDAFTKTEADGRYVKKSGDTMTGVLYVDKVRSVNNQNLLLYHPNNMASVTNTQWGVGAADSQGVISSSNTSLLHYRNGVGSATIWDSGNDGSGSGLDADLLDGYHYNRFVPKSIYNPANGVLVTTSVAQSVSKMMIIRIVGHTYNKNFAPIDTIIQIYPYQGNSFTNGYSMLNNGYKLPYVKVFYADNVVKLWIPYVAKYWSYDVYCYDTMGGSGTNLVTAIADSADVSASGTAALQIDPKNSALTTDNVASATKLADNTSFKAWGQTFFENGQPKGVSGDMTGVGSITMTGNLTVPRVNINASTATSYITATASDNLVFSAKGKALLILKEAEMAVRASTDIKDLVKLGTSSTRWANVCSVLGNFSGQVTAQSLKIGDCEITWDGTGLKFSKGIYSEGFVSARGKDATGGTSGGSGSLFGLYGNWSDTPSTSDALRADLGKWLYDNKLGKTEASSTYLSKTEASSTYLSKTEASTAYQPKGNYLTGHQSLASYVTTNTTQSISAKKTFIGGLNIRYNADTSNALGIAWLATDGTTLKQSILAHNTVNRIILNPNGSTSIYNDAVGKYSLIVGVDELTYNTKSILREDNYTSYVAKLGTSTVGSTSKPIYLNAGTPTALSATVGSSTKPVYLNAGTVTACSYTFGNGSGNAPISNGTVNTNLNADLLDGVHNGEVTANLINSRQGVIGGKTMQWFTGQPSIGVTDGSSFRGSSNNYKLWSFPDGGTGDNNGTSGNIMDLRLHWSNTYWSDIFMSPNNQRVFYRTVANGLAHDWREFAMKDDNVASATKLADNTAFKAWGQEFFVNGKPKAVSGNMTGVGSITMTGSLYGLKFLTWIPSANTSSSEHHVGMQVDGNTWAMTKRTLDNAFEAYLMLVNLANGKMTYGGDFAPYTNHAYNLGSATQVWERIYGRYIDTDSGYNLRICVAGSEKLTLHATAGYVGVNRTNPAYQLDVAGDARVSGTAYLDSNVWHGGDIYPRTDGSGYIGKTSYLWNSMYFNNRIYLYRTDAALAGQTDGNGALIRRGVFIGRHDETFTPPDGDTDYGYSGTLKVNGITFTTCRNDSMLTHVLTVTHNGRVGVLTAAPGYAFDVDGEARVRTALRIGSGTEARLNIAGGALHCTTGFYSDSFVSSRGKDSTSDIRLKRGLSPLPLTVEQIAGAPAVTFRWRDMGEESFGSTAQYWEKVVPQSVHERRGWKHLAYDALGLTCAVVVARRVESHGERIRRLEEENRALRREIAMLGGRA